MKKGRKVSVNVTPGEKYGRLTIIKEVNKRNGVRMVSTKCDCGTKKVVRLLQVVAGTTQSCGCLRNEIAGYYHGENSVKKLGDINKRTPEYNAWRNMYKRCNYRRFDIFHNETYINRNITICDRWREKRTGYSNFLSDMGRKPTPNHSLERVNNDKGYSPENCVWATSKEQARNTSRTVRFIKGTKYGKLTLIKEIDSDKPGRWVEAKCKCGSIDAYLFRNLFNGRKKSCGCDKKRKKK